ncbi:glycoside hydrolase family 16 protein [Actinoallomurus sp. NPDC050550]|uniref:glycoside hydrolase family 16 protein n=1 Tax=Actinoallomurus sp. NPDC050550 TaxID=3154937 RepID=UPI0033F293FC
MRRIIAVGAMVSALVPAVPAHASSLVFAEEFTGGLAKWTRQTGCGWGNGVELQCYTASGKNAAVKNGVLTISALKQRYQNRAYTSARLASKFTLTTGDVKVRARMSRAQRGAWPAIWTLGQPEAQWPKYGEIDLMENGLDGVWTPQYHVHTSTSGAGGSYRGLDATKWHIYEARYRTGKVMFLVDGKTYATKTYKVPAGSQSDIILNVAVGGAAGKPASAWKTSTLQVDYVRVYR